MNDNDSSLSPGAWVVLVSTGTFLIITICYLTQYCGRVKKDKDSEENIEEDEEEEEEGIDDDDEDKIADDSGIK